MYIGDTSAVLSGHNAAAMVPNVLFYDNNLVTMLSVESPLPCMMWPVWVKSRLDTSMGQN